MDKTSNGRRVDDKFRAKRIRRIVFSSCMVFLLLSLAVLHFFPHTGSIQEAVQTFLWVCAFCWMGVYVPEIPEKYWYPTVFGLLAIPFFTLFFGSAALLCGLSLNRLWLLCAIALTVWLVKRLSLPGTLKFTLPCIFGIWLTVTFFASLTLDFSYEGESVQKPMTILLSQGWNPIYTPCSVFLEEKGIDPASFDSAGAAFYPKGQAVISAVYADFFGNIEAGDGVYFLMIPCCIFLFYKILKKQLNFGKYEP